MRQYVAELHDIFDIAFFRGIANTLITDEWLGLPDPVALAKYTDTLPVKVRDHEYLIKLRSKYPGLADQIKFMKSSQGSWPVHSDTHRKCAINIPLFNTEHTTTDFYEGGSFVESVEDFFGDIWGTWYTNEYLRYVSNADIKYRHVLNKPAIINTAAPHGISNNGDVPRIICSWAYSGTYEEAVEEFSV